ncbi:hypothetical protein LEM8419_00739 [Neolewinella maritima]|uniref:SPOR domain-containing protein n=2 Tax=Neolewinella maritima TaxID=1383882 RepID=A0ABM9AXK4_9BACT|nr:hypothetical protein LEM8419_00739 [Neolewinella maritima]
MCDFYRPMPYTEQQIRGLAINFLRFHYKLRPRYLGSDGTRITDRPHYYQGVLIDARLAYQRPDRSYFTATVEATSLDRQHEILYQTNYWRIGVHALVWTLVTAALITWLGSWVPEWNLFRLFGLPTAYLVLASLLVALFLAISTGLSRLKRYRYIYAVDQFKRFYADAQWVAYDTAIFAADSWRTRRRYRELERQCVKYGFGLLAVEADKVVRNVMSPSQVDQFAGSRIKLPRWLARAEVVTTPPPTQTALQPVRRARPQVLRKLGRRAVLLRARGRRAYRSLFPSGMRRRPGYYTLGAWVLVLGVPALVGLGWGVYRQAAYSPVAEEGGRGAGPDLAMLETGRTPAPPLEIEEGEYRRRDDSFTLTELSINVPEGGLIAEADIADTDSLRRYRLDADGVATVDYACLPLYTLGEPVFILLFGRYASFGAAREWALELNRLYQSPVTVAAGDCVEAPGTTDYLLYIDGPTREEGAANLMARQFQRRSGLEVEIVEIR